MLHRPSWFYAGAIAGALSLPALPAEATVRAVAPPASTSPVSPAARTAQFLYVYNTGSPGLYSGEYARYSLPDLTLLEMTSATGVASPETFGKRSVGYFVDEAPASQGAYAIYLQPIASGTVAAVEQFSGVPCASTSLATGPTGNFYVVQYCSTDVLEFKPGPPKTGKSKQPIAVYTGGNLGGTVLPTYAAVDHHGNLYVGDNGGGITYFAAGSTTPAVIYPTGNSQAVTQIVVDSNDDVWSVHYADSTKYYFRNDTSCVPQPSGTVVRNEIVEHFSGGQLVQKLYSPPTTSSYYDSDGVSIAVDSAQRVYVGAIRPASPSVLLDYAPQSACPDLKTSLSLAQGALPQVAVDDAKRFYVTDYIDNTISSYQGGSVKVISKITQATGIVNIESAAVSP